MQGLIFLDTETTGIDPFKDRLFEVCYLYKGKIHDEYFKPPVPISVKAQSITHVTNKMVADKKSFSDSKMEKDLQELLKANILVAHNAAFDINVLAKENIEVGKYICTFKVIRFLDEAENIPEYNLQYLRYFWELELKGMAHNAKDDVLVLEAVFNNLYKQMQETYPTHEEIINKMVAISSQPFIFKTFKFGKHKGKTVKEVAESDKNYIQWLLGQKMQNPYEEEDWIFTLKHYLNKH